VRQKATKGTANPKWFGAVGDGETDDTQALQESINFAESVSGSLHLREGVFLVSNEISLIVESEIEFIGAGASSTTIKKTERKSGSDENAILKFNGVNGGEIRGISFNGINENSTGANTTGNGIYIYGSSDISISNVNVSGGFNGVKIENSEYVNASNIICEDVQHGFLVEKTKNVKVHNLSVRRGGGYLQRGFFFNGENTKSNVSNLTIKNAQTVGIFLRSYQGNTQTKNINLDNVSLEGSFAGISIKQEGPPITDIVISNVNGFNLRDLLKISSLDQNEGLKRLFFSNFSARKTDRGFQLLSTKSVVDITISNGYVQSQTERCIEIPAQSPPWEKLRIQGVTFRADNDRAGLIRDIRSSQITNCHFDGSSGSDDLAVLDGNTTLGSDVTVGAISTGRGNGIAVASGVETI
jgi:hypothetical protein